MSIFCAIESFGHESSTSCKYILQNIYGKTGTNLIEYQIKM